MEPLIIVEVFHFGEYPLHFILIKASFVCGLLTSLEEMFTAILDRGAFSKWEAYSCK
jgi:hypothetical protein